MLPSFTSRKTQIPSRKYDSLVVLAHLASSVRLRTNNEAYGMGKVAALLTGEAVSRQKKVAYVSRAIHRSLVFGPKSWM